MGAPFSLARHTLLLGAAELGAAGVVALVIRQGPLGGYFPALPVIPTFFLALGVASTILLRRGLALRNRRSVSYMLGITVGRLLLSFTFLFVGLILVGEAHRIAFVLTTAIAFSIAFAASTYAARRE